MAICNKCKKPIEDGKAVVIDGFEYCAECSGKKKADESYLDSLLSSVSQSEENPLTKKMNRTRTTAAPVRPRVKPVKITTEGYNILSDSNDDEFLNNLFDSDDIPDFPLKPEDLPVGAYAELADEEPDALPDIENAFAGEAYTDPGEDYTDVPDAADVGDPVPEGSENESGNGPATEATGPATEATGPATEATGPATEAGGEDAISPEDVPMSEEDSFIAELLESVEGEPQQTPAEDPIEALNEAFAIAEGNPENIDFFGSDATPDEIEAVRNIAEPEPEVQAAADGEAEPSGQDPEPGEEFGSEPEPGKESGSESEPGLLSEPEPETRPSGSKVQVVENSEGSSGDEDILEFWNQINSETGAESAIVAEPGPTGDEPSETDSEQDELAALLSGLPGINDPAADEDVGSMETPEENTEPKKKKGFFARIFGNVREDLTEEQIEERKQAALDDLDRKEEQAVKDKEAKEAAKAEAKAAADEAKKAKAAAAAEAKKKKEQEKKEKADKKAALRKALVEEIEENEGKINKVGASFVFLVFGAVLAFVAVGTSVYTYRVAIRQAEKDFNDDKYEDAYNDIYGINVREEDQELYDQIMVVNYVNTQLLAYLHYTGLDMENEALDSLLKGLRRYEKYIFYARELQVDEDFDFLKGEILSALSEKYGLSEEDAYNIIGSETQELYSRAVRDVVEGMKN